MIHLDVDLDLLREAGTLQESIDRRDVVVVLMLGRLHGLGLDEDCPLEAELVLVLHHQVEEAPQLIDLALQVGVEQRVVTLAASPQHVIRTPEPMRGLERVTDLGSRMGEDLWIRIGRRTGHVPRVGEQVRRPPEQLHAGPLHHDLGFVEHDLERVLTRPKAPQFRRQVPIMEREEWHAQLLEELEGNAELLLGQGHCIPRLHPRARHRGGAEGIAPSPAEGMPVTHGQPQVLRHGSTQDEPVGLIPAVGQRVGALESLVANGGDVGKEGFTHRRSSPHGVHELDRPSNQYDGNEASPRKSRIDHAPARFRRADCGNAHEDELILHSEAQPGPRVPRVASESRKLSAGVGAADGIGQGHGLGGGGPASAGGAHRAHGVHLRAPRGAARDGADHCRISGRARRRKIGAQDDPDGRNDPGWGDPRAHADRREPERPARDHPAAERNPGAAHTSR
ncbi:conserved hypothetical protein [Stigmatella aurantiaca DW4/3-1]|uniref:Uncharacterized protein n=1 Tax=Stigmatella aurantiaca (strain DW4/3-1) TaxID=378806 RepID=Q08YE1_STIAD|nr:conserved hypothetical protein [Stigmatella aurantiaca DW4/3-1]